MKTYSISLNELKTLLVFMESLKVDSIDLEFSSTGIGTVIIARERTLGKQIPYVSLDITDRDSW